MPDNTAVRYSIPIPAESPSGGRDTKEVALNRSEISTVKSGGPNGIQTHHLRNASATLFRYCGVLMRMNAEFSERDAAMIGSLPFRATLRKLVESIL